MTVHKNDTVLFFLSLFAIFIPTPIGIVAVTDLFILYVATLQIIRGKFNGLGNSKFILLLILLTMIFSMFYHARNDDFDWFSHVKSLIRVAVILVFLSSKEFLNLINGGQTLRSSINKILHIHSIVIILDFFLPLPIEWGEYTYIAFSEYHRARGLFGEPSFAAIYILANFFLLFQNGKIKIKFMVTPLLALLSTTSLIGILGVALLFLFNFRKICGNGTGLLAATVLLVLVGASTLQNNRVANIMDDSSGLKRLVGAYLTYEIVRSKSPIFGFGFGGGNLEAMPKSSSFLFVSQADIECTRKGTCNGLISNTAANSFAVLLIGGGFIVVFLYLTFVLSIVGLWIAGWVIIIFLLMSQGSPLGGFILTFLFLVKNLKKDIQNNN